MFYLRVWFPPSLKAYLQMEKPEQPTYFPTNLLSKTPVTYLQVMALHYVNEDSI